jgi:hypothetical protein
MDGNSYRYAVNYLVGSTSMIERSGFDSRRYQIFWEVVGLERGPLILVSTTKKLLGRNSSGSGLEIDITAVGDPPHRQNWH